MNIVFLVVLLSTVFLYVNHWAVKKNDRVGYHVLDMFSREQVDHMLRLVGERKYDDVYAFITTHPVVLKNIEATIGPEYEFKNYMLAIEKSSVSTCHRDENGQFFNRDLKHPSYTVLFYLKEIDGCLDIVEQSHEQSQVLNFKKLKSIQCVPGQAILFDADMIHSGSLKAGEESTRIQLKLHHKDDVFPKYLEKMHQTLDASKDNASTSTLARSISCTIPVIPDLVKNGQNVPESLVAFYKDMAYGKNKYNQNEY
jgi:hypothetical protein